MNPPLTLASPYFGQPSPEGRPQEYRPDRHLLSAARLAYSLRRPLLLTGEPGCGKTDFAWVLADQLGKQHKLQPNERMPFICRVNSQTRAQDLLYHYDALQRLSDAQHGVDPALARDPRNYVELRELGLGLLTGASAVVLIDEIDKAPRDLPNDLLHVIEEGWFRIPELRRVPGETSVKDPPRRAAPPRDAPLAEPRPPPDRHHVQRRAPPPRALLAALRVLPCESARRRRPARDPPQTARRRADGPAGQPASGVPRAAGRGPGPHQAPLDGGASGLGSRPLRLARPR
ncbi:MAG: AAA family ATPase [Deltaproteobacteria bacterium]|nr:AAA family ATPase [Deltaproteobacteria bacterium]